MILCPRSHDPRRATPAVPRTSQAAPWRVPVHEEPSARLKRKRDGATGHRSKHQHGGGQRERRSQTPSLQVETPVSASGCGRCSRNASKHTSQTHADLCRPSPTRNRWLLQTAQRMFSCTSEPFISNSAEQSGHCAGATLASDTLRGQRRHSPTHPHLAMSRQPFSTLRRSYPCLGHISWPEAAFSNARFNFQTQKPVRRCTLDFRCIMRTHQIQLVHIAARDEPTPRRWAESSPHVWISSEWIVREEVCDLFPAWVAPTGQLGSLAIPPRLLSRVWPHQSHNISPDQKPHAQRHVVPHLLLLIERSFLSLPTTVRHLRRARLRAHGAWTRREGAARQVVGSANHVHRCQQLT